MKLKDIFFKVLFGQILIDILVAVIFYFLIPFLMNYADYTVELNLAKEYLGVLYFSQAIFMFLPYTLIMSIFLTIYLKDMLKYGKDNIDNIPLNIKNNLTVRLINTPLLSYLLKMICVPVSVFAISFAASSQLLVTIKLTVIIATFFLIDGAIIYTFINK